MAINYSEGDASQPNEGGLRIILNPCEHSGRWSSPFQKSLSGIWPELQEEYRIWASGEDETPHEPGVAQVIQVEDDILITNMNVIEDPAQGISTEFLSNCLIGIAGFARDEGASVHLNQWIEGEAWDEIEAIIQRDVSKRDVPVFIYQK